MDYTINHANDKKFSTNSHNDLNEIVDENEKMRHLIASLEKDRGELEKQLGEARQTLKENQDLAALVSLIQNERVNLQDQIRRSKEELDTQHQDLSYLKEQKAQVEAENQRFFRQQAEKDTASAKASMVISPALQETLDTQELLAMVHENIISEMHQRNFKLTNLYVTNYRLHERLDRQEVIDTIRETIINVVGSEQLAIFEVDRSCSALSLINSFGLDEKLYQTVPIGAGLIGSTVLNGEIYLANNNQTDIEPLTIEQGLTACIPLKIGERVIGAVAIFQLLPQKAKFCPLDFEVFDLLAARAGKALFCSTLYARACTSH